ncbi:hypothetical protein B0J17DRAFT_765368 [Rhizoctonia solani]|nr:hypothetical protein B0J17DRAFT_765368 [Rhizoctonia solani]
MAHIGLIRELSDASSLLKSAMNRYTKACATILSHFEPSGDAAQDLLDSVLAELPNAFDCETNLQQAMGLMYRVRNQSPSYVPISILPPEVMARVIWFSGRCCLPRSRWDRKSLQPETDLVFPETALQVCHRWRQIALTSHDLWSHIDIDLLSGSNGSLFRRASAFAENANQAQIDLHIRIDFFHTDDQRLTDFCRMLAPRIRSIDFQWNTRSSLPDGPQSLLANLFSSIVPGVLCQFRINAQPESGFIVASDSAPFDRDACLIQKLPVSTRVFEDVLSPITSMQLNGMYPHWTSRTYAGLTELDLGVSHNCEIEINITEFELANILQASPGLRTFCFGLKLSRGLGISSPIPEPVKLNHLEIIQLTGKHPGTQESVLRMICPGQLPLRITTEVTEHFSLMSPYWSEFISFLARSKTAQLHIRGVAQFKVFLEPSEILPWLRQLQVLNLCGISLCRACEEILGDYDATSFRLLLDNYDHNLHQNLKYVHLVKCRIYWPNFRHVTEMHPTQTFILNQCELITTPPKRRVTLFSHRGVDATQMLTGAVRKVCPVVELNSTYGAFEELGKFELGIHHAQQRYSRLPFY